MTKYNKKMNVSGINRKVTFNSQNGTRPKGFKFKGREQDLQQATTGFLYKF